MWRVSFTDANFILLYTILMVYACVKLCLPGRISYPIPRIEKHTSEGMTEGYYGNET